MRWNMVTWISWLFVIVGAINWGLIGLFNFDLVATLFGGPAGFASRIVYTLVGLAAVWQLIAVPTDFRTPEVVREPH